MDGMEFLGALNLSAQWIPTLPLPPSDLELQSYSEASPGKPNNMGNVAHSEIEFVVAFISQTL
jgi:hypothetical protein